MKIVIKIVIIFLCIGYCLAEEQDTVAQIPLQQLKQQAENGDAAAQTELARRYAYGEGVPQDYAKCYEYAYQAAEKGNARAMRMISNCYINGIGGVAQNTQKGIEWITRAAEAGDTLSMGNLGVAYLNGVGAGKDVAKAREWFEKAAARGDIEAQHNLGLCYLNGIGVAKDEEHAEQWLRIAADNGNADAKELLRK